MKTAITHAVKRAAAWILAKADAVPDDIYLHGRSACRDLSGHTPAGRSPMGALQPVKIRARNRVYYPTE